MSPFKSGAEVLGGFVNRNDPEFLAKQAANKNRELMELEKRNELGLIPDEKMVRIRDDTLDFSAKRLNQASEVLERNVQNSEVSNLALQRNMLKLENVVGGVGKNLGGNGDSFNQFRNKINVGEGSAVGQRVGNKLNDVGNERLVGKLPEGASQKLSALPQERGSLSRNSQSQNVRNPAVENAERSQRPSSIRIQEESQTLRGRQNTLNQERVGGVPIEERAVQEGSVVPREGVASTTRTGTQIPNTRTGTQVPSAREGATNARTGTQVPSAREGATNARTGTQVPSARAGTDTTSARTGTDASSARTGTTTRATRATRESGTSTFQAQRTAATRVTQSGTTARTGTTQSASASRTAQTRPARPAQQTATQSRPSAPARRPPLTGGVINDLREDDKNIFNFVFFHDW